MINKNSFNRSFNKSNSEKNRRAKARRQVLNWEGGLESRQLLAASLTLTSLNDVNFLGSVVNNNLKMQITGTNYVFTDPSEVINVTSQAGTSLTFSGSGTNTVTVTSAILVNNIDIQTGSGNDTVQILSTVSPTTVDTGAGNNDRIIVGNTNLGINILGD